ncbi:MAG: lipopolysaccharide transport periplasmic protein LptA [Deltaproteobacteria bacterium]|nr:lipopolysaccharide transport periplasmic protein LptA [Deltaproteobacteria bacterium]
MPERFFKVWMSLGLIMVLMGSPLDAQCQSKPGEAKGKAQAVKKEEPIQIVSDRLDAYHEKRMVVFSGNAVATQGERTIKADTLTIYYKEEDNQKKSTGRTVGDAEVGNLERVEAKGHVTITEPNRIVTGDDAVFEQDIQKITMTGNAVLREGANVVRGDKVTVFLNENRGVVESAQNRRVTATIYPAQSQDKQEKKR